MNDSTTDGYKIHYPTPVRSTATARAYIRLYATIMSSLTDEELGHTVGAYQATPADSRTMRYRIASQASLREAARRGI